MPILLKFLILLILPMTFEYLLIVTSQLLDIMYLKHFKQPINDRRSATQLTTFLNLYSTNALTNIYKNDFIIDYLFSIFDDFCS